MHDDDADIFIYDIGLQSFQQVTDDPVWDHMPEFCGNNHTLIIASTGLSQTNVSFHLRVLREAGIVKAERSGGFVFYCVYDFRLLELLSLFDEWRQTCNVMSEETST